VNQEDFCLATDCDRGQRQQHDESGDCGEVLMAATSASSSSSRCRVFRSTSAMRAVAAAKAGMVSLTSERVFDAPLPSCSKAGPQDAQTDALVAELRAQLAEMRSQRDAWQGIAERLALSAPKPPEPEPKPAEGRRSWWRRLQMTG
jgi:hypothetical protein